MAFEAIPEAPMAFDALVPVIESPDYGVGVMSGVLTGWQPGESEAVPGALGMSALAGVEVTDVADAGHDLIRLSLAGWADDVTVHARAFGVSDVRPGARILCPEILTMKSGLFGLGRTEVVFEPDPDQDEWEQDIWLPVLRIHRPKHAGCTTVCTLTQTNESAVDTTIEALGVGGGGGGKWSATLSAEYEAPMRCLELCNPAKLRIVWGTTSCNGVPVAYGTRVTVENVNANVLEQRPVTAAADACGAPAASIADERRRTVVIDKRKNRKAETDVRTLELEAQATGKVKVGIAGGRMPLAIALNMARTTTEKITIQSTLAGGAQYLGYVPSAQGALELCWTTR